MDCNLPGSSIHGILQARILEWVAISFSRGSSRAGNGTRVSALQADSLQTELETKGTLNLQYQRLGCAKCQEEDISSIPGIKEVAH